MLYDYSDMITRYRSAYQIDLAVKSGELFKIARGLYSDTHHVSDNAVVCTLYPQAVLTMDSAFYLYNLTDVVPLKVHVATPRNSTRIHLKQVKQYFMEQRLTNTGVVQQESDGTLIRVFSKERMLVELLRKSATLPLDYYKELIASYRKIVNTLDMQEVENCIALYRNADRLFEKLQMEVL